MVDILNIYNIGAIISGISTIIFTVRSDVKKAIISYIIMISILLLKYMLGG